MGRELALSKRDDIFAATPPLESLRFIASKAARRQNSPDPKLNFLVMSNDVRRAYFYAPAKRPIYISIPAEDLENGDEDRVGVLNLSLYGTRDAASNWADAYSSRLVELGFRIGAASPCNFHHAGRDISVTVHGDDFTSCGTAANLKWLKQGLEEKSRPWHLQPLLQRVREGRRRGRSTLIT